MAVGRYSHRDFNIWEQATPLNYGHALYEGRSRGGKYHHNQGSQEQRYKLFSIHKRALLNQACRRTVRLISPQGVRPFCDRTPWQGCTKAAFMICLNFTVRNR